MTKITITYENPETQPPVFVAGSFTDWQAVELDHHHTADDESTSKYSKTLEVAPGEHQYKFRLGFGEWWVCDSTKPVGDDGHGNTNNLVSIAQNDQTARSALTIDGAYDSNDEPDTMTINELKGSYENFEADSAACRAMRSAEDDSTEYTLGTKFNKALYLGQPGNGARNHSEKADTVKKTNNSSEPRSTKLNGEKPAVGMVGGLDGTDDGSEVPKPIENTDAALKNPTSSRATEGGDYFGNVSLPTTAPLPKPSPKASTAGEEAAPFKFPAFDETADVAHHRQVEDGKEASVAGRDSAHAGSEAINDHTKDSKISWYAKLFLCGTKNNMVVATFMVLPIFVSWVLYH